MQIKSCLSYRARTAGRSLVTMPDGKSVFKLYYLDIPGRDDPARYEWGRCGMKPEEFERLIVSQCFEGVGFITAFPHITKVFRFAPSTETVLHVRAFHTQKLQPLDLAREDGYLEFACLAEAVIANDEYRAWAAAGSVRDYLHFFSDFADGPVVCHTKLAAYWPQ